MDKNIYKKAAAGNSAALAQLLEEKTGSIYAVCRLLAGYDGGAIKAAKDTWTDLLEKIKAGGIKSDGEFASGMLRTAAALCKEQAAKSNPKAFSKGTAEAEDPVPAEAGIYPGNVTSGIRYAAEALAGVRPAERFAAVLSLFGMPLSEIADVIKQEEPVTAALANRGVSALCSNLEAAGKAKYSIDIPKRDQLAELFKRAQTEYKAPEKVVKECAQIVKGFEVEKLVKRPAVLIAAIAAVVIAGLVIGGIFARNRKKTEEDAAAAAASQTGGEVYATVEVENYGSIKLKLQPDKAPITVENFVTLAESGFYDGLTFHRIMEGFMIQGGDPDGNGTGGSDKTIKGEFLANGVENDLSHTRGAISMARNSISMDSASSQFFIVHQDSTFLDGQYACFGYVTEGMEVVDAIAADAQPVDDNGTILPEEQPVITSVTIER